MRVIRTFTAILLGASMLAPLPSVAVAPPDQKQEAIANVDSHAKMIQVMVDTVFSYGEPGFQEFKTGAYLTDILARNGFKITKGVAGIPTAWTATRRAGHPRRCPARSAGRRHPRSRSRRWECRRCRA